MGHFKMGLIISVLFFGQLLFYQTILLVDKYAVLMNKE
jgi:hypothetical protein